jgi:hypothetical protein
MARRRTTERTPLTNEASKLNEARHPMRELLVQLPRLLVDAQGKPDLLAPSPSLLLSLSEDAEAAAGAINLGMSALGALIAYSAPELEDGTISSDSIEHLGWLLSELGAVCAACLTLSVGCRRANASSQDA